MEATKGKLTNLTSGDDLAFAINPARYTLSQSFAFAVEPCLGFSAPLVSFRSGDGATLSFQLDFDTDADKDADPKKLIQFLKSLNKVDEGKKSVPEVKFSYGEFSLSGFVTKYTLNSKRFDAKGNVTSASVDITLLSNGGFEHGA